MVGCVLSQLKPSELYILSFEKGRCLFQVRTCPGLVTFGQSGTVPMYWVLERATIRRIDRSINSL